MHSEKRRILHLRTVTGRGGGPEKTLLNSHRFVGGEYELELAYLYPQDDPNFDLELRASQTGARLVAISERGPIDHITWKRLKSEVRRFRPHILHAHDYKTNLLALALSRLFRVPAVTTLHGYVTFSPRLNFYYALDRWVLRRMTKVMAVSRDLLDLAVAAGVAPKKCVLIENGIDTEQFLRTQSSAAAKASLGIRPDIFVLGAVGRLMPEKGFDVLIRSVARLEQLGRTIRLLIAGEGQERQSLEALIAELGCGDRVELLGYRTDVPQVLEACDGFVLSSRREASPNVVLEAMALQTPVIATRVAGVPEMLQDGTTGLLIDPDDIEGLAAAIQRIATDPELRTRLVTEARSVVATRYSFAERMRKECAVYDDLLGNLRAAAS
jgi:glycosyltransferase involved in cell wall biosynthesis